MSAYVNMNVLRSQKHVDRVAEPILDAWLVGIALSLLALGLVMVASASMSIAERQYGQVFYFVLRQMMFITIGLLGAAVVMRTRLIYWEKAGGLLLAFGVLLLVLVLMPGVGHKVNGSARWISFGIFNLQASELVKLCVIVYFAGYLVRRGRESHR